VTKLFCYETEWSAMAIKFIHMHYTQYLSQPTYTQFTEQSLDSLDFELIGALNLNRH